MADDPQAVSAAVAAIRDVFAWSGVGGYLHLVIDDENVEDDILAYCAQLIATNPAEHVAAHLAAEQACLEALGGLTEAQRTAALAQYEAEELEAFYAAYPERRPPDA